MTLNYNYRQELNFILSSPNFTDKEDLAKLFELNRFYTIYFNFREKEQKRINPSGWKILNRWYDREGELNQLLNIETILKQKINKLITKIKRGINSYTELLNIITNDTYGILLDAILSDEDFLSKFGLSQKNTSKQWNNLRNAICENLERAINTGNTIAIANLYAFEKYFPSKDEEYIDKKKERSLLPGLDKRKNNFHNIKYLAQDKERLIHTEKLTRTKQYTHREYLGPRLFVPSKPFKIKEEKITEIKNIQHVPLKEKNLSLLQYKLNLLNKHIIKQIGNKNFKTLWDLIYRRLFELNPKKAIDELTMLIISFQRLTEIVTPDGLPAGTKLNVYFGNKLDFLISKKQAEKFISTITPALSKLGIIANENSIKLDLARLPTDDHSITDTTTDEAYDYEKLKQRFLDLHEQAKQYDIVYRHCLAGVQRSALGTIADMILTMRDKFNQSNSSDDLLTLTAIVDELRKDRTAVKKIEDMTPDQLDFLLHFYGDIVNSNEKMKIALAKKYQPKSTYHLTDKQVKQQQEQQKDLVKMLALYCGIKPNTEFDNVMFEVLQQSSLSIKDISEQVIKENEKSRSIKNNLKRFFAEGLNIVIGEVITPWFAWIPGPLGILVNSLNDKLLRKSLKHEEKLASKELSSKTFKENFLPKMFLKQITPPNDLNKFIKKEGAEGIAMYIENTFTYITQECNKIDFKNNFSSFIKELILNDVAYSSFPKNIPIYNAVMSKLSRETTKKIAKITEEMTIGENFIDEIISNEEKSKNFITYHTAARIANMLNVIFSSKNESVRNKLTQNGNNIVKFMELLFTKEKEKYIEVARLVPLIVEWTAQELLKNKEQNDINQLKEKITTIEQDEKNIQTKLKDLQNKKESKQSSANKSFDMKEMKNEITEREQLNIELLAIELEEKKIQDALNTKKAEIIKLAEEKDKTEMQIKKTTQTLTDLANMRSQMNPWGIFSHNLKSKIASKQAGLANELPFEFIAKTLKN